MTDKDKKGIHIFLILAMFILIITFETSLWYKLLSPIPNPQIWLSLVLYTFLYRGRSESLITVYAMCILVFLLTTQPLGFLLLTQTALYLMVVFVRNRIFIPGSFYFGVIYSSSVLAFHILLFTFSWLFEVNMTSSPQVWKWIVQSILAFMISPLVYALFSRVCPPIDHSTEEGVSL